jgi:hypothetical protein
VMGARHKTSVALASVSLLAIQLFAMPTARATDCATPVLEQTIFVLSDDNPVFGSQSRIDEADRPLAFDCTSVAENHHTAHVRDTDFASFAEVGYVERWSTGHYFNAFWEVGIGTMTWGGFGSGPMIGCCFTVKARVVNDPSSNRWKFFGAVGSNPFHQFGPTNGFDAGFHQAYPFAEVGRRGDPGTSAAATQSGLLYKANRNCTSNCWTTSWSNNFLHRPDVHCIPGYEYSWLAPDSWKVRANANHTC